MSNRVELQLGYVLHTRPYRDTSLLVDLLSDDYGKISLIAKGARKAKSQQRFLLQAFQPLLVSWQGKSSLKTLIGVEADASSSAIPAFSLQGSRLYSAMYINELLVYLLPQDDPTDQIFSDYQHLLSQLLDTEQALEPCLRCFELSLLESLGYGVDLNSNADTGEPIVSQSAYYFMPGHGFVDIHQHPEVRDHSYSGRDLLAIAHQDFSQTSTRQAAKYLSRCLLKPLLRGRELKSRELFVPQSGLSSN